MQNVPGMTRIHENMIFICSYRCAAVEAALEAETEEGSASELERLHGESVAQLTHLTALVRSQLAPLERKVSHD